MKLTHEERESHDLVDYLSDNAIEVSTSVIAEVEVLRNLRKFRVDRDEAMRGFYLVSLDDDTRRMASELGPTPLRALDAIHVASALAIGDRNLEFVTYDDRQAEAARAAGLKVV